LGGVRVGSTHPTTKMSAAAPRTRRAAASLRQAAAGGRAADALVQARARERGGVQGRLFCRGAQCGGAPLRSPTDGAKHSPFSLLRCRSLCVDGGGKLGLLLAGLFDCRFRTSSSLLTHTHTRACKQARPRLSVWRQFTHARSSERGGSDGRRSAPKKRPRRGAGCKARKKEPEKEKKSAEGGVKGLWFLVRAQKGFWSGWVGHFVEGGADRSEREREPWGGARGRQKPLPSSLWVRPPAAAERHKKEAPPPAASVCLSLSLRSTWPRTPSSPSRSGPCPPRPACCT